MHKGCDQEPHPNWWRFSGLKMLLQIELRCTDEDLKLHVDLVHVIHSYSMHVFVFVEVLKLLVIFLQT